MKIETVLGRIGREDAIKPRKWKVEAAVKWIVDGATEPEESGGAKLSYEDVEGAWRYLADLKLIRDTYNGGISDMIEKLVIEDDAPAWIVLPFIETFRHSGLTIEVRDPFRVDDIPF